MPPRVLAGWHVGKDVETETGKAYMVWNLNVVQHIPVKMCCFDIWSQTVARHRWSHLHCPRACYAKCSRVTPERTPLIDRPTLFQSDSFYILCCSARPYMLLSSTPLAQLPPVLAIKTNRPLPKTQTHMLMLMTKMLPVLISRQLITRAATHHLSVNLMWFNLGQQLMIILIVD